MLGRLWWSWDRSKMWESCSWTTSRMIFNRGSAISGIRTRLKRVKHMRTMEINNKMRFHGVKMEDVTIVEKILRSLTPKFDYVICSIEQSKDIDVVSLNELKALPNDKEMGEKSNFTEKKEVETLLMTVQVNKEFESDVCYVDTGCNNHMSGKKSYFSYLYEGFHSIVSFGDSSIVNVTGKSDIKIRPKNVFVDTISNVLYIPNLKSNMLSAGQLQEKSHVIIIQKGVCEIYYHTRRVIAVVQMSSNRLFPLKIESVRFCLMAKVKVL
ncbi:Uncharacterized protein TCM_019074 [Theobroma cacao]|uniref:Retrovirus-related Pol polyprotein from transposon TNT 1-94-like beta-barrel domain-containing protein n=1 Tax=Theobroma cacao TaxID=3641 RepID=A0A061EHI0_THECC|nr:Uncharacterized protein TCM_019074 [Theobroma cacao]